MDRVFIAGGGTAGHVNAGLSIINYIREKNKKIDIIYIGTKRGIESKIINKDKIKLKFISARGLKRENFFILIYSIFLIPISIIQSTYLILKYRPKHVVGIGGFSSGPIVLISHFFKIKTYVLEQNSVMGFTNKLLSQYVDKIFISFPLVKENSLASEIKNKLIYTGNPIRDIFINKKKNTKTFNLFIFGGSQGARAINYGILNILKQLEKFKNLKIYHQTGYLDFKAIRDEYLKYNLNYELFTYILDIEKIYNISNLIISRAGASSISEIISTCIPSILIPLPTAADNHQYHNAKYLEKHNACLVVKQEELNKNTLIELINKSYSSTNYLNDIKSNLEKIKSNNLKRPKPEELIYREIFKEESL